MASPKLVKVGNITVGLVPIADIHVKRKNFRRMSEAQRATLKQSIAQHGFKSFLLVCKDADGNGYELIDGHHRLEELVAAGEDFAPVLVLDDADEAAQLARLQFNVSADTDANELYKFMAELQQNFDTSVVAVAATVSPDFLAELAKISAQKDAGPELPPPSAGDLTPPSGKKKPEMNGLVVVVRKLDGLTMIGRVNSLFVVPKAVHDIADQLELAISHETDIPSLGDLDDLKKLMEAVESAPLSEQAEDPDDTEPGEAGEGTNE